MKQQSLHFSTYTLSLLIGHDLLDIDGDIFVRSRAYRGKLVAVVSAVRYNPSLAKVNFRMLNASTPGLHPTVKVSLIRTLATTVAQEYYYISGSWRNFNKRMHWRPLAHSRGLGDLHGRWGSERGELLSKRHLGRPHGFGPGRMLRETSP